MNGLGTKYDIPIFIIIEIIDENGNSRVKFERTLPETKPNHNTGFISNNGKKKRNGAQNKRPFAEVYPEIETPHPHPEIKGDETVASADTDEEENSGTF